MTSLLSVLRRRRALFIGAFVIAAVGIAGTPAVRARLPEAITAHLPFGKFDQSRELLDPTTLNTESTSKVDAGTAHRPTGTSSAKDIQPVGPLASRAGAPRLGLSELVGSSIVPESPVDVEDDTDGQSIKHDGAGGLGAVPSPIAGHSGGYAGGIGGGGGGGGLPGGFPSGVRSDFNDRLDNGAPSETGGRLAAAGSGSVAGRSNALRSNSNSRSSTTVVVTFDPNAPFASDLTKLGAGDDASTDQLLDSRSLAANQSTTAPLSTPEPATLLLVANGVGAILGSRALRRRRRKNAQ